MSRRDISYIPEGWKPDGWIFFSLYWDCRAVQHWQHWLWCGWWGSWQQLAKWCHWGCCTCINYKGGLPSFVQMPEGTCNTWSLFPSFSWWLRPSFQTPTSLWNLCRRPHSRQLCCLLWLQLRGWVSWLPCHLTSGVCYFEATAVRWLSDRKPLFVSKEFKDFI